MRPQLTARILLLEADPTLGHELKQGLEQLGAEVVLVRDGQKGLARAVTDRFDVVVVSAALPGMNGFRVCKRIKEDPNARATPLFLVGDAGEQFEAHEKLPTRADVYLTKPLVIDELAAGIHNVLAAGPKANGAEGAPDVARRLASAQTESAAVVDLRRRLGEQAQTIAALTRDLAAARAAEATAAPRTTERPLPKTSMPPKPTGSLRPAPPELVTLREQLRKREREVQAATTALGTERSRVQDLTKKLTLAENESRGAKQTGARAKEEIARLEKLVETLRAEKDAASKAAEQASKARADEERRRAVDANAAKQLAELRAEIDKERQASERRRVDLEKTARAHEEEVARLRADMDLQVQSLRRRLAEASTQAADAKISLEVAQQDHQRAAAAHAEELARARAGASAAGASLGAERDAKSSLEARIAKLEVEAAEREARHRDELQSMQDACDSARTAQRQAESALEEAKAHAAEVDAFAERVEKEERGRAASALERHAQDLAQLETRYAAAMAEQRARYEAALEAERKRGGDLAAAKRAAVDAAKALAAERQARARADARVAEDAKAHAAELAALRAELEAGRGELAEARREASRQLEAGLAWAAGQERKRTSALEEKLRSEEEQHQVVLADKEAEWASQRAAIERAHATALAERDEELARLRAAHVDQLARLERSVDSAHDAISREQDELVRRAYEQGRDEITEALDEATHRAIRAEDALATAQEQIAVVRDAFEERIAELESALTDVRLKLEAERDARLAESVRTDELEAARAEQQRLVDTFHRELMDAQAEVAELEGEIAVLRGELTNVRRELDHEIVTGAALEAEIERGREVLRRARALIDAKGPDPNDPLG